MLHERAKRLSINLVSSQDNFIDILGLLLYNLATNQGHFIDILDEVLYTLATSQGNFRNISGVVLYTLAYILDIRRRALLAAVGFSVTDALVVDQLKPAQRRHSGINLVQISKSSMQTLG